MRRSASTLEKPSVSSRAQPWATCAYRWTATVKCSWTVIRPSSPVSMPAAAPQPIAVGPAPHRYEQGVGGLDGAAVQRYAQVAGVDVGVGVGEAVVDECVAGTGAQNDQVMSSYSGKVTALAPPRP